MKNNKIKYILVAITVILWTLIVYRIINYRKDAVVNHFKTGMKINRMENEFLHYTYALNYHDPFLGSIAVVKQKRNANLSKSNTSQDKNKGLKEETVVILPPVTYKGLIRNNNKTIAMLLINNSEVLVKENSEFKSMFFSNFSKDSISIKYSGKLFKIKKQN
jgi:hypothetical protein